MKMADAEYLVKMREFDEVQMIDSHYQGKQRKRNHLEDNLRYCNKQSSLNDTVTSVRGGGR